MHPAAKSVRALRSGWLVRRGALGNDHATTQSLGSDDRPSLATDIWTTALLTRTRRELATPVRLSGHKDTDGLACSSTERRLFCKVRVENDNLITTAHLRTTGTIDYASHLVLRDEHYLLGVHTFCPAGRRAAGSRFSATRRRAIYVSAQRVRW